MASSSGPSKNPPAIALMGPTASGKSSLALELAKACGGEIVSADSMQLYRGLDLGTAKPSQEERASVPHHLLDILEINQRADLFSFQALAEKAIAEIRARGHMPIVAGGTGLYMRALIYGLDPMPSDQALRKELDALYDSDEGHLQLKRRMMEEDAADYEKCHAHRRKLIRSLEVFLLSGVPMCELQKAWPAAKPRKDMLCFKLYWDREELKRRIAARCDAMLAGGWIDEARELIAKGLLETPTACQALGYSLIAEHLAGKLSFEKLSESIKTATWQYARRQSTWFRNQHPEAEEIIMPSGIEPLLKAMERSQGKP